MSTQPETSADSPANPEIEAARKREEELVHAKAEYEPLEQAVKNAQKEADKAASVLERLHQPLGKAAFDALLAGQIAEQPAFSERMKLNATIAELRKEHDALAPPPDAGMMAKMKAKAKQLLAMGNIASEEGKISKLDTQIGKQLLDSGQEASIRCSTTESVLSQITTARANVAQAQQKLEQATTALESKKAALREAFGLAEVESVRSLDAELAQLRKSIRENEIRDQRSIRENEIRDQRISQEKELKELRTSRSVATVGTDWKNVIVTTRDLKQDYEVLDIVCVVVGGNTWKDYATLLDVDVEAGWLDRGYVDVLFKVATAKLRFDAHEMGANAVIGLEFDNDSDQNGNVVIGYGTAVKFKRPADGNG